MTSLLLLALVAFAAMIDVKAGSDVIPNCYHGFPYPVDGWQHVLVMVAVGIVATRYAGSGRWVLPGVFVLMMAVGIAMGMATRWFDIDQADFVIMGSTVFCCLLVLSNRRPAFGIVAPALGFLALFHGYEHGLRVPTDGNAVRYSRETVAATTILLSAEMVIGFALRFMAGRGVARGFFPTRDLKAA